MTVKSPNKGDLKFLYKYNSQQSIEQNVEALAQIMRKAGFNIVDCEPNKNFEVVDSGTTSFWIAPPRPLEKELLNDPYPRHTKYQAPCVYPMELEHR